MNGLPSVITPDVLDEGRAAERLAEFAGCLPMRCPSCGTVRLFKDKPCRCKKCGKKYTWRTGSIFEGTKLRAAELLILIDRLSLGLSDKDIAGSLKITADTVKVWRFKISLIKCLG